MSDNNEMQLRYQGSGADLLLLFLGNAILTLLTFGIYNFWARTKVREFHYSHTDLGGDRFAYHGTGVELFKGYLRIMGIIILIVILYGVVLALLGADQNTQAIAALVLNIGVALFGIWIINSARRYRLSRSSLRGVRFSYHGKLKEFAEMMIKGGLATGLTLGFYSPWFQNQRRAFLVNHARWGSVPFEYAAPPDPLVKEFFKAVILTIPTLGFVWVWYTAFQHRYFWSNTHFAGARFESKAAGGDVMGLMLVNLVLIVFTAGIATPWVVTRTHAFWAEQIKIVGAVDWAAIQQRAQEASAIGDDLADSLDIDVGLDV